MSLMWRWVKRAIAAFVLLSIGLLSPVAYSEVMCRPSDEPVATQAMLDAAHHRPETRTLMTYPEWHIVHAYEDYGRVIQTGDPHDYGFTTAIGGFWRSLCALSKASGELGAIDGGTKQMVYVIGVSFTAELLAKAAYEETLGRLFAALRGPTRAPLDDVSAEQAQSYALFLRQVPWYKWDFHTDVETLETSDTGTLRDRERRIALGLEYRAKAAYAEIIAGAVAGVGADARTLRMLVIGASPGTLASLKGVTIVGETQNGIEIETPRYRELTQLMQEMAKSGINFVEIAGNDDIMFTILSDTAEHPKAIYSAARQGFDTYRHLILTQVSDLASELRTLEDGGGRLEHIHDY